MQLLILNGQNLNLLGKREVNIYGTQPFEDYFASLQIRFPEIDLHYFQSNSEGGIIDKIHEVGFHFDGIILNGGAYTHTSVAIADAITGVNTPVVEVHISNIYAREAFRHHSYSASNCIGSIIGLGLEGYALAIQFFQNRSYK